MPHNSVPPAAQFIASRDVAQEICKEACEHIHTLSTARILVLAMLGGAFITMGALFSILLSTGVEAHGIQLLLQARRGAHRMGDFDRSGIFARTLRIIK